MMNWPLQSSAGRRIHQIAAVVHSLYSLYLIIVSSQTVRGAHTKNMGWIFWCQQVSLKKVMQRSRAAEREILKLINSFDFVLLCDQLVKINTVITINPT